MLPDTHASDKFRKDLPGSRPLQVSAQRLHNKAQGRAVFVAETRAGFARILKQEEFAMPVITFDKEHLDEGFMYLSRRGEVGCLPNDLFVITDALFELLQKSRIPFIQVDNHQITQQGERGLQKKNRQADRKISL
jgi:hypothetical protein